MLPRVVFGGRRIKMSGEGIYKISKYLKGDLIGEKLQFPELEDRKPNPKIIFG